MLNQAGPWPRGHAKPSSTMTPGSCQTVATTPIKIIDFYSWGGHANDGSTAPSKINLNEIVFHPSPWQVLHLETFLCYSSKYLKHPLQMSGVLEFSVLTRGSKSGVNWDLRLMLKGNFTWKVCWSIGYGYVWQTIVFVLQLTVLFFWEISYCRGDDLSFLEF